MNDLQAAQFWFGFASGICTVVIGTLMLFGFIGGIGEIAANFRRPQINEHALDDVVGENGETRFV